MNTIYARKIVKDGEDIIELDLNKPWPKRVASSYPSYRDDIEKLIQKQVRHGKKGKEFITILN